MEEEREWDVKKIIVGIVAIATLIGVGYAVKVHLLDKRGTVAGQKVVGEERGEVATGGDKPQDEDEIDTIPREIIEKRVEAIKRDISNLKPEDIVKQEPVQKILKDLESLRMATEERVKEEAKNAVCEQAKRIFCQ